MERSPPSLSFSQQRLWFLHHLAADAAVYQTGYTRRLEGIDVEALRRALEAVVHRHASLRTTFPAIDGEPSQRVHPPTRWELPVDDAPDALARAAAAQRLPFDLAAGPLLRTQLVEVDDAHVLFVTLHHIIADDGSHAVFWRDVWAYYYAFAAEAPADLPPLPVQPADHAAAERQRARGGALTRQLAYWTARLASAPDEIALPFTRPRPPRRSGRGRALEASIDARLAAQARALARSEGASLFATFAAAVRVLLSRYAGHGDVLLGTRVTQRDAPELEGVIGRFVNTLVLRNELRPGDTFAALLAREHQHARAAYDHQRAPFELVVDALGVARGLDRPPLVQVSYVHHDEAATGTRAPAGETDAVALFDLAIETWERGEELGLTVIFDEDLCPPAVVTQLVDDLQRLLALVTREPARTLASLDLPGRAAGTADSEPARPPAAPVYVAPRDELESAVARSWRELLGVERVGVDDDFFALGGTSMLASRVCARLEGSLGVRVALRTLYARPTLGALAAEVRRLTAQRAKGRGDAAADPCEALRAEYHELLHGKHRTSTTELVNGNPDNIVTLTPHLVGRRAYDAVRTATVRVYQALLHANARVVESIALRRELGIGPHLDWLFELDRAHGADSLVARLDGFIGTDGVFRLIECNSLEPGASPLYQELIASLPITRELAHRHRFTPTRSFAPGTAAALAEHARRGGVGTPTIAIIDGAREPGDYWLPYTALNAGWRIVSVEGQSLRYERGRLWAGDEPIDFVLALLGELLEPELAHPPLLAALAAGAVRLSHGISRAFATHYKSTLELLSDPVYAHLFDLDTQRVLATHIPWTRVLRPRTTTYQGRAVDLLELITSRRAQFVIKPCGAAGGNGVVVGRAATDDQWTQAIHAARTMQSIVQERVDLGVDHAYYILDPPTRSIVARVGTADLDPFVWNGTDADGAIARISAGNLHNKEAGAHVAAVWIVEDA